MEENVILEYHPAMFRNRPFSYILCLLLIPVAGIGLIILLIWWLKCRAETLIITDKRIIKRTGIVSRHTTELRHADVRSLETHQGVFQRFFNVGSIGISSASQGSIEIAMSGLPDPEGVKATIDRYRV